MMDFTNSAPQRPQPHVPEAPKKPAKREKNKTVLIVIGIAAFIVATSLAAAIFFFVKYNSAKNESVNQDASASVQQAEKKNIVSKVSKIYKVPDEEPTLAQVNNADEIKKEQEFFKDAQNKDYILVFTKAKIAVLYRESDDRIINMGPVSVNPPAKTTEKK